MDILVTVTEEGRASARVLSSAMPVASPLAAAETGFDAGPPALGLAAPAAAAPLTPVAAETQAGAMDGGAAQRAPATPAPGRAAAARAVAPGEVETDELDAGSAPTLVDVFPTGRERPPLRVIE